MSSEPSSAWQRSSPVLLRMAPNSSGSKLVRRQSETRVAATIPGRELARHSSLAAGRTQRPPHTETLHGMSRASNVIAGVALAALPDQYFAGPSITRFELRGNASLAAAAVPSLHRITSASHSPQQTPVFGRPLVNMASDRAIIALPSSYFRSTASRRLKP